MGFGYFDIVSEDIIESDFQRGDSGCFYLPLLHLEQQFFAVAWDITKFVQFGIYSRSDYSSFVDLMRSVFLKLKFDLFE